MIVEILPIIKGAYKVKVKAKNARRIFEEPEIIEFTVLSESLDGAFEMVKRIIKDWKEANDSYEYEVLEIKNITKELGDVYVQIEAKEE